jgi:hypothetical protein
MIKLKLTIFGLCFLLSSLFQACSDEPKVVTLLSPTKVLEIETTAVIQDNCFNYSFLVDSLLVFISECDTNYFHIYNKNTLEFIMKFGTRGRAPFEFETPIPYPSNTATLSTKSKSFYFYDINLEQTKIIDFNKLIQGYDVSECVTSTANINLFGSIYLNLLEGSKITGQNIDRSEGLFFIYDSKSEKINWVDYLPNYRMQERYRNLTYRGRPCSDGKNIAFASRYFDQVLFFNNEGQLLKEHYFSEVKKPVLSDDFSGVTNESPVYFTHIYGNTKSCFVERLNKSLLVLEKEFPTTQLLEFDWNGSLINVYELNKRPKAFSVDETTNTLYCIINEETPSDSVRIAKINI